MPHIHTLPGQHDLTVGAYIIRLDGTEPVLLLHQHKKLHKYLQFGGHVEIDENPWEAVAHELIEEAGYEMSQLAVLQPPLPPVHFSQATVHPFAVATLTVQFGDTDHRHTDIAYAFVTRTAPNQLPGEGESSEIVPFTRAALAALPDDEIPADVREIGLYVFDECLPNWTESPATGWN